MYAFDWLINELSHLAIEYSSEDKRSDLQETTTIPYISWVAFAKSKKYLSIVKAEQNEHNEKVTQCL